MSPVWAAVAWPVTRSGHEHVGAAPGSPHRPATVVHPAVSMPATRRTPSLVAVGATSVPHTRCVRHGWPSPSPSPECGNPSRTTAWGGRERRPQRPRLGGSRGRGGDRVRLGAVRLRRAVLVCRAAGPEPLLGPLCVLVHVLL